MAFASSARRNVLRGAVIVVALLLIASWIRFATGIFVGSQSRPAPAGIMMPMFFCILALGAALAAVRGEGVAVALAGGLSLVPMGFLLVFFPGSPRLIGLLDITLIALGIALMRTEVPGPSDVEAPNAGPAGDPA